ncbi:MAG: shikimate dehydrogenase [Peptococcaceae bacterium]
MIEVNGNTKLTGIIGNPLGHSLSPLMQNTFFDTLGLNSIYIPLKVTPENLEQVIAGLWALGFSGVNVTIPYKEEIIKYLTGITPEAEIIGAVNTLIRKEDGFWGDNTDGRGFINALTGETGWVPKDKIIVILGSGGSARAVGISLAYRGVKKIFLINRNLKKAAELASTIKRLGVSAEILDWENPLVNKLTAESDLIINTTPLGMKPANGQMPPINTELMSPGQLIVDLIYNPLETRLLREARGRGCRVQNGLGMLIHQGVLSFEIWTGRRPSLAGIKSKLEAALND